MSECDVMNTRWRPTSKAQFSGLFSTSERWLERMTSYYPWIGDVTRSKLASTWESNRSVEVYWFGSLSTHPLLTPPLPQNISIMHVKSNLFCTNELSAQYWYQDNSLRLNTCIPGLHKLLYRAEKRKTNKSIMDSGWAWPGRDACMCLTQLINDYITSDLIISLCLAAAWQSFWSSGSTVLLFSICTQQTGGTVRPFVFRVEFL